MSLQKAAAALDDALTFLIDHPTTCEAERNQLAAAIQFVTSSQVYLSSARRLGGTPHE